MKALSVTITILFAVFVAIPTHAADKPIKAFILAGQSNMVGYGDSTEVPEDVRKSSDRVLRFEGGKWQPLWPHQPANGNPPTFRFGPEIGFGHEMAKAWPDETIGIIKFAIGGTSLLAWKPEWSKEDADRVGQGGLGSLYKRLMEKVKQAKAERDIEIVGFLWLQGGGDMKNVDVAKEYLDNLKSLVAAVRKDTGVADLPFLYGSARIGDVPDDLSDLVPKLMDGRYPAAQWVVKAQSDAQKAISNSKMVILRNIERHGGYGHYNTAGQLEVGKLFAEGLLDMAGK